MSDPASQVSDVDAAAREALRLLGAAPDNWVPDHPGIDHNVLVVGGGQNGSTFAFALSRAGIGRVSVIDAAVDEHEAGIWRARARMHQLRTPKTLTGPELGVPALGFQAWYEARHGAAGFATLERIPRLAWADYLDWYRRFLGVQVRYATRLVRIEPVADAALPHFRLHLAIGREGRERVETARKVILATGVAGNGAPALPAVLHEIQAAGLAAHTADDIDFDGLRGKRVAVIGAAASAFDAAAVALESGAAAVHLYARRDHLAATPVIRARGYPGIFDNYRALPDATRWHHAVRFRRLGSTAPVDSIRRVTAWPGFHLHLGTVWTDARVEDGKVIATAGGEAVGFDFVIAGTGYRVDAALRPELAGFASSIARWRDRYVPPADERDDELGESPYLGEGLEYLERAAGTAPWLRDIHVFNAGGFVSAGIPLGDVLSIRRDLPAVVARISRDLVLADLALHEQRIRAEVPPEFDRSLYEAVLREAVTH
ncbi:MAG TPA: NAD(P)/FAD-dependent oxidoreductase [Burkholderiaceae bacterium]|nr:NAD(P)/FAD-dependent oxidoreductase [Burkholderiaceae bacterium]